LKSVTKNKKGDLKNEWRYKSGTYNRKKENKKQ
jgi:hypothetical protein